jgi:hypothetical protein
MYSCSSLSLSNPMPQYNSPCINCGASQGGGIPVLINAKTQTTLAESARGPIQLSSHTSSTSKQFYSPNEMVKKLSQLAKDGYLTCSQLLCSSHASRVNFRHINALQWSLSKMGTASNLTRFGASARVDFVTCLT